MILKEEFQNIKGKIFKLYDFESDVLFELLEREDVYISFDGKKALICGKIKSNTARALTLFIKNINEGRKTFEISETKHFKNLGFSLDVSRNAIMKIEKVKEYIDILASLGFDSMMLYMEDTFELPGYEYFGYRRGRYTLEELKEIDDYGFMMGVEIVPSIQTLGHLEQYLRWREADAIKENSKVLLCGEEKTYKFIEDSLRTISSALRSRRINIGCDEASGVGCGNYLINNPYRERFEIITEHLKKVYSICKKYDYKPMICGDLYLAHFGESYYDFNTKINEDVVREIPGADILYWDYYHKDRKDYEKLLTLHKELKKNIIFYGGIWTWCGILPNPYHTYRTMEPALSVMLENNIKEVWAATYGDDGTETNMFFAVPSLTVFSEKCFKGTNCTDKDIEDMSKFVTKVSLKDFYALSEFHYPFIEKIEKNEYIWPNYMGKKLFYTDVLYNFANTYDFKEIKEHNLKGYELIRESGIGTKWEMYFDYARLAFEIILDKTRIITMIRDAYDKCDLNKLSIIASKDIPEIFEKYESIHTLAEKLWLSTNKVFGWEELDSRFGAVKSRLLYAKRTIESFVKDDISKIEELEYEFIDDMHGKAYQCGGVAKYAEIKSTALV
ncbi:MAG: beta-N-acetylhexosaminidase [Ruminococcaceae bacterium]|nr:beta-N-acetylhexosaminidase [Oscillospiraceae bacterium]